MNKDKVYKFESISYYQFLNEHLGMTHEEILDVIIEEKYNHCIDSLNYLKECKSRQKLIESVMSNISKLEDIYKFLDTVNLYFQECRKNKTNPINEYPKASELKVYIDYCVSEIDKKLKEIKEGKL